MGASGRVTAVPHRVYPGDERGVPAVRGGRRVPAATALGTARLGVAPTGGRRTPAVLGAPRRRPLVGAALRRGGAGRALASRRARELVRGPGLLPVGGAPAPDGGRVGDGGHAGACDRPQAPVPVGRRAADTRRL